jgi:stage III sporulation protein AD
MDTAAIVGIGLTAAALAVLLRQYKPEYAMLASLMAGIVILGMAFGDMRSVLDEVNGLISGGIMRADYAGVLLKALGICFVTQIACDSCRDAGRAPSPSSGNGGQGGGSGRQPAAVPAGDGLCGDADAGLILFSFRNADKKSAGIAVIRLLA